MDSARPKPRRHTLVVLKLPHQRLPLPDCGLTVENQACAPEDRTKKRVERRGHLAELREDEHFLLPGRDHLRDLAQPGKLPAVRLAPRAVTQPLRGVIADLFEAHQRCEHDAAALHSVGSLELGRELGHRLLIEGRLLARQLAESPHFGLVRQVGDDGLVGLQAPQDVWPDQRAKRCVRIRVRSSSTRATSTPRSNASWPGTGAT